MKTVLIWFNDNLDPNRMEVPRDWTPPASRPALPNIKAFAVKDNSLAAEGILDGHTLIVDTDAKLEAGKLAVLSTKDGGLVCKRVNGREARSRLRIGRVIKSQGPLKHH